MGIIETHTVLPVPDYVCFPWNPLKTIAEFIQAIGSPLVFKQLFVDYLHSLTRGALFSFRSKERDLLKLKTS